MKIIENIKGFQELSLMEWTKVVASIIFLGGCNFRCFYCHNHTVAFEPSTVPSLSFDEILNYFDKKRGWIDGVVISGGEPTIYREELPDFMRIFKQRGLKVKLFTNGYNVEVIERLIRENLIDAISMDIKHCPERYEEIIRVSPPQLKERIHSAVSLIKRAPIEKEFRLTLIKGFHSLEDISKIKNLVMPVSLIIQNVFSELIREEEKGFVIPFSEEEFLDIKRQCEV